MKFHDVIDREKTKLKTYPISGALAVFLIVLVLYHAITGG